MANLVSLLTLALLAVVAVVMLIGSRTKQVNAYGKRKQRIINVNDSDSLGSIGSVGTGSLGKGIIGKMKPRGTTSSSSNSAKAGEENNVITVVRRRTKPKEIAVARVGKVQQQYRELRIPLSPLPAVRLPRSHPHKTPAQNKKIVDVDIKVFDDNGNVVSSQKKKTSPASSSESTSSIVAIPRKLQGRRKMNKLIVLSDDEDEMVPAVVPVIAKTKPVRKNLIDLTSPAHSPDQRYQNATSTPADMIDLTSPPHSPEQTHLYDFALAEEPPAPRTSLRRFADNSPIVSAKRKIRLHSPYKINKLSPPAAKVLTLQEYRSLPSLVPKQSTRPQAVSPPRLKLTSSFPQPLSRHQPTHPSQRQPRKPHVSSPIVRRAIPLFPSNTRAGTPIRSSTLRLAFTDDIRQEESSDEDDFDDLEDELDVLAGRLSLEASAGLASVTPIPLSKSDISPPASSSPDPEFADERLQPLLKECRQSALLDFTQFVTDQLPRSCRGEDVYRKIGEASYSEVFGIGNIVLKVVPMLLPGSAHADEDGESPAPTPVEDVVKELQVTRAMGEIPGFVNMADAYVVKGVYPEVLMKCWDEFDEEKGSESVRPGEPILLRLLSDD